MNLPDKLKKLDVSRNPGLSISSYQILGRQILDKYLPIVLLNFEGNEMGDESCKEICSFV